MEKNDEYAYSTPSLWAPTILKDNYTSNLNSLLLLEDSYIALNFFSYKSTHLKCTSGQSRSWLCFQTFTEFAPWSHIRTLSSLQRKPCIHGLWCHAYMFPLALSVFLNYTFAPKSLLQNLAFDSKHKHFAQHNTLGPSVSTPLSR